MQKYQNNETYRSYLSIYEKDKKLRINKEKSKNYKNKNENRITYLYQKDSKKCDYNYGKVLFKINSWNLLEINYVFIIIFSVALVSFFSYWFFFIIIFYILFLKL